MKVSGPKGPGGVPPTPADDGAEKPQSAQSATSASFRELLQAPATKAPEGPLQAAFADIQARLRAGELDATRAGEQLVEAVVRAQLPEAAAALQQQLREVLQRLLREDPVLASKLRELAEADR
jgi:hypothetical protein